MFTYIFMNVVRTSLAQAATGGVLSIRGVGTSKYLICGSLSKLIPSKNYQIFN